MKVSVVTAPGETQVVDAPKPHGRARGRARQDPGVRNLWHRHAFHLDGRPSRRRRVQTAGTGAADKAVMTLN